jgi:hypothetical protein
MSEARFKAIVDAYGGDPARWPIDERDAALRLLQSSGTARAAAQKAGELDTVLRDADVVPVPDALSRRLLDDFERTSRRWSARKSLRALADAVWPGAPLWQPAIAFGLALALGVGVAALVPLDLRPNDDASGGTFALDAPLDSDAGQDI